MDSVLDAFGKPSSGILDGKFAYVDKLNIFSCFFFMAKFLLFLIYLFLILHILISH